MEHVVICGASGLVGRTLASRLYEASHEFSVVGRSVARLRQQFPRASRWLSWSEFESDPPDGYGAIVNLAGASVMHSRWSARYKRVMTSSRLESTGVCARVAARNSRLRLISASSVHAYGIYRGDHAPFTENDRDQRTGTCYLQELIDAWEAATEPAASAGCAVSCLRIGIVFSEKGGALSSVLPPFRWGIGGRHGSGRQVMSWISLDDLVSIITFLLDRPDLTGPINAVAPVPCSNAEFARAVGRALRRPSLLPLPAMVVRLAMGGAGTELVLRGQRVIPRRLEEAGFKFLDTEIDACMSRLLA